MIFVCDATLGKLARSLRMLGLDAPCVRQDKDFAPLAEASVEVLFFTKSTAKAGRHGVVLVHGNDPREQVMEIRQHIEPFIDPDLVMTRCIECNVRLVGVRKEEIEPFVPEYVYHHHDTFTTCPSCRRVYWEGSHTDDMHGWIERLVKRKG